MAYVYKHIRPDTNEVFYIGIGVRKNRINSHKSRNPLWKNIVNKYGMISEIIEDNLTWDDACSREQFWIKCYGRKNNNTGILSNMTDGGDGLSGFKHSDESKLKTSNSLKNNKEWVDKMKSKEYRDKLSTSLMGHKGYGKGIQRTDEVKNKIRNNVFGEKNHFYGKTHSDELKKKMSEKNSGKNNPNAVKYVLFNTLTNDTVCVYGHKSVLMYYNNITNKNKKDSGYLIKKIKENQIEELKFVKSIKLNSK